NKLLTMFPYGLFNYTYDPTRTWIKTIEFPIVVA
ncbi:unnamed protein product, partial [marine sediment metagenome]